LHDEMRLQKKKKGGCVWSTRTRKTRPTLVCQTGGMRLCAKGYVRQNRRREKITMTTHTHTHTHKRCATSLIVLPTPKAFVLHRSRAAPRVCIFRACDVGRELSPASPPTPCLIPVAVLLSCFPVSSCPSLMISSSIRLLLPARGDGRATTIIYQT
uniref:Uncharacterized protein n=1 Tax=Anopheles coluzzii TaxID=1518534 RepID=A0A8W7P6I5_ANOCL